MYKYSFFLLLTIFIFSLPNLYFCFQKFGNKEVINPNLTPTVHVGTKKLIRVSLATDSKQIIGCALSNGIYILTSVPAGSRTSQSVTLSKGIVLEFLPCKDNSVVRLWLRALV